MSQLEAAALAQACSSSSSSTASVKHGDSSLLQQQQQQQSPRFCQATHPAVINATDPVRPALLCETSAEESSLNHFDKELLLAEQPPGPAEVLVTLLAMGLGWLLLSYIFQA
jgi:hypothetical protein